VIGDPPSPAGATHDSSTSPEPTPFAGATTAVNPVGAPGADATSVGVAEVVGDAGPVPAAFTAETRNRYSVPFVRSVTNADPVVDWPSSKVVQLEP
jgi:hypothetical protein